MEIQPIVIGTAGHIDHGKSTLVRALTGVDPDRLKEEKERGLTIDLGFAPLELPDGRLVGIVDVPGHEKFIRNMVAGASGIDLVVLVVAADDGVMPQTKEHLQIMQLLGVERGFVALSKVDLVEQGLVELAEEDVRENLLGTFLEDAPIQRVSAKTGEGLDALKEQLFAMAAEAEPRRADGVFRMPIQRVFSKRGFGTVVTGIPVSGQARVGDTLQVLPGGQSAKVRGLNAYREKAEVVRSGHSSAINLSDVDHKLVSRGDVIATPNFFSPQRMVAARIHVLPGLSWPVRNRMSVRLHTGTADAPGEVVILDREEIPPGESGLVQVRVQEPVVCAPGDRFILRLLSPALTLGGGVILEESRYRLKRFKGFVLEELSHQEESLGSPATLAEAILARQGAGFLSTEDVAVAIKRERGEVEAVLAELESEGRLRSAKKERWIHVDPLERARTRLRASIDAWFEEASHRSLVETIELRRRTDFEPAFLSFLLDLEEEAGALVQLPGGKLRVAGRGELDSELVRLVGAVEEKLVAGRFQPPSVDELASETRSAEGNLRQALEVLEDQQRAVRVGGELWLARGVYEEAQEAVRENCERNGKLEIPELRDRLKTSRKFLIPLLEHFDAAGLTLRQGGHRVLRRR